LITKEGIIKVHAVHTEFTPLFFLSGKIRVKALVENTG